MKSIFYYKKKQNQKLVLKLPMPSLQFDKFISIIDIDASPHFESRHGMLYILG